MSLQPGQPVPQEGAAPLRALCIGRHCFLSEHIARYFASMGVVTTEAVGLDAAVEAAREASPDVVICDYDLLATIPLEKWERDELLSNTPVIAVEPDAALSGAASAGRQWDCRISLSADAGDRPRAQDFACGRGSLEVHPPPASEHSAKDSRARLNLDA